MKKVIVFALLLLSTNALAVVYTSNGTGGGDWSDVATWGGGGFPGAGDSAIIQAGDRVGIDGNVSVGTSPSGTTTYDLDISGDLIWPTSPGASWTMNVFSSIRINSGGTFDIGTSDSSRLDCAYTAEVVMNTSPTNKKYAIYVNGGQLRLNGCENYTNSTGTVTRARIKGCIDFLGTPGCTAGSNRIVTLDRDVNWNASNSWVGDTIFFGVGGSASTKPATSDETEYITSWGIVDSETINGVTFTEDHNIGDLVENATRNIVIRSNSTTYHSRVYPVVNFSDPYVLSWVLFDEFGDSTSGNYGAINFNDTGEDFGSIDYAVLRNCSDGGGVVGFYLSYDSFTVFSDNIVHDTASNGIGFRFTTSTANDSVTLANLSYYEGSLANAYATYFTSNSRYVVDTMWCSRANYCIYVSNGALTSVTDSLLHGATGYAVYLDDFYQYWRQTLFTLKNCELFNGVNDLFGTEHPYVYLDSNEFVYAGDNCLFFLTSSVNYNVRMYNNSYDGCNQDNNTAQSGVFLGSTSGEYFGYNEHYGQSIANKRANIIWAAPYASSTQKGSHTRFVCNDCLFATPDNVLTCGVMDSDGIYLYNCTTGSYYATFIGEDSYLTLHDKDQVSGTHIGWGPGGMIIEKEAVIVQDSTIALKVTPGDATEYAYVEIGKVYVSTGDTLQVDLDLRKDEAVATDGRRPRLALEGCGFLRGTDYDEMSDVTDTWETVTVNGNATHDGVVHLYVGVKNTLSGVDAYSPTWPPTLEIYADKIVVTK